MDQQVTLAELLSNKAKAQQYSLDIFHAADTDNSGFIEFQELVAIMQKLANKLGGKQLTNDQVMALMQKVDTNADSKISLEEFQTSFDHVIKSIQWNNGRAWANAARWLEPDEQLILALFTNYVMTLDYYMPSMDKRHKTCNPKH